MLLFAYFNLDNPCRVIDWGLDVLASYVSNCRDFILAHKLVLVSFKNSIFLLVRLNLACSNLIKALYCDAPVHMNILVSRMYLQFL